MSGRRIFYRFHTYMERDGSSLSFLVHHKLVYEDGKHSQGEEPNCFRFRWGKNHDALHLPTYGRRCTPTPAFLSAILSSRGYMPKNCLIILGRSRRGFGKGSS